MVVRPLCLTGRVSQEDVPLLELAHMALQDTYIAQKKLARLQRIKDWELNADATDQVGKLTRLVSRRGDDYRKIMATFGVSPIERARLIAGVGGGKRKSLTDQLLD